MSNHKPVLLKEVLQYLQPQKGESYLDVTAGYGGHAQAVLDRTQSPEKAVLVDRDAAAIAYLKQQLADKMRIIHQDFLSASRILQGEGQTFDMILADLGLSSPQLESSARGFAIKQAGPLDMRMDRRQNLTAAEIVNHYSEDDIARIFSEYGEEPKAKQIAQAIIRSRPITSTDQLAEIAARFGPFGSRIHPATRIFQALRIAVNDELSQLTQALPIWLNLLAPGGRLAVISFHSLEDRIVKKFLAEHSVEHFGGTLQILTKKPIVATNNEVVFNLRARSAKLRAAAKIKTNRKD